MPNQRRRGYKMVEVTITVTDNSAHALWKTIRYFCDIEIISNNIGKYKPNKCLTRKLIIALVSTYRIPKRIIKLLLFLFGPFTGKPNRAVTPEEKAIHICQQNEWIKELQKFYTLRFTAEAAQTDVEDKKLYRRARHYTLPIDQQVQAAIEAYYHVAQPEESSIQLSNILTPSQLTQE